MKTKLITILLISFMLPALCKSNNNSWFSIGVKAGYNQVFSKTTSDNPYYYLASTDRMGGNIGIYMRLGRRVYCQPEVSYSFDKFNAFRTFYNYDTVSNRQMFTHTINLPVLLGVHIVNKEISKLSFVLGPVFSFNVDKSTKNIPTIPSADSPFTVALRNTRVGFDCGLSMDIWRFTLGARYTIIQDLYKFKFNNSEINPKGSAISFPNHCLYVSLGFKIF